MDDDDCERSFYPKCYEFMKYVIYYPRYKEYMRAYAALDKAVYSNYKEWTPYLRTASLFDLEEINHVIDKILMIGCVVISEDEAQVLDIINK